MRRSKKPPPPVFDEKKRKSQKKEKRPIKKISSKENKEPGEEQVHETASASLRKIMHTKDIYLELEKFKLTESELRSNNYPAEENYTPRNLVPAGCDSRTCVRCCGTFEVFNGVYLSSSKCLYHPKKPTFSPRSHSKRFPCCGRLTGDVGCTEYDYHVTVQHGPKSLTKTTSRRKGHHHQIYSLDCEMSYTTEGLEVTRVGLVDIDGQTVFDTFVKPANKILDYNTQFSGVEKHHLEHVTTTLDDVIISLNDMINEDTILVGHALNNDLAVLGLIHKNIVDTSILYPDEMRPWNKKSLKALAFELLGISIQNDPSGHDCIDDAWACLQLALLKVQTNLQGESKPFAPMENLPIKQTLFEKNGMVFACQQEQQQTPVDSQNYNFTAVGLPYVFHQHHTFKKHYYNSPPISYYAPYTTLMKGYV